MALNERMMASDKLHINSMNSINSGIGGTEPGNPFQNMPFFLPSLNGNALQSMAANNINSMATGERGGSLHPSHCPTEAPTKQRDAASTNRNSKHYFPLRDFWFIIAPFYKGNWSIIQLNT